MSILTILLTLVIIGILLWAVNTYVPMADSIKTLLNVVVIVLVIVWLIQVFGLFAPLSNLRVHKP